MSWAKRWIYQWGPAPTEIVGPKTTLKKSHMGISVIMLYFLERERESKIMGYRGSGCTAIETCSDEHGIRGGKPGRKKA